MKVIEMRRKGEYYQIGILFLLILFSRIIPILNICMAGI